jgi:hypothetical protein
MTCAIKSLSYMLMFILSERTISTVIDQLEEQPHSTAQTTVSHAQNDRFFTSLPEISHDDCSEMNNILFYLVFKTS